MFLLFSSSSFFQVHHLFFRFIMFFFQLINPHHSSYSSSLLLLLELSTSRTQEKKLSSPEPRSIRTKKIQKHQNPKTSKKKSPSAPLCRSCASTTNMKMLIHQNCKPKSVKNTTTPYYFINFKLATDVQFFPQQKHSRNQKQGEIHYHNQVPVAFPLISTFASPEQQPPPWW